MNKIKNFGSFVKENVESNIDSDINNTNINSEIEDNGGEYVGDVLLKELAEKTGGVLEGNSVTVDGKKIDFFSETEAFHVDGEKFKTVDEVISHLDNRTIKESRRTPRSFRRR
jgi:hypothetical protein